MNLGIASGNTSTALSAMSKALASQLQSRGYAVARNFLSPTELDVISGLCQPIEQEYGVRMLLDKFPQLADVVLSAKVKYQLLHCGLEKAKPVRSLFFNKNAEHNWMVPWHQDLSIAVQHRIDTPGYQKWTSKDDYFQVEPPASVLESIVTLRFALDAADADNGALKMLPRSHLKGKLSPLQIQQWASNCTPDLCTLAAGDLLIMKPLLLHASAKAKQPTNRRVVHIEFGGSELAPDLSWAESAIFNKSFHMALQ